MRGYLLEEKRRLFGPIKGGNENFFKLTGSLKETVADNAAQFSLLNEINQTINDYKTKST